MPPPAPISPLHPRLCQKQIRRQGRARAGFTLIEVCVAMAIGVLILGVATLSISAVQGEARLKRMASGLETQARQSLLQAVMDQRAVRVPLDGNLTSGSGSLEVRRLGEKAFRRPQRGEVWDFSPTGVCEPLSLRVQDEAGEIELEFDPLTGCAIRKEVRVRS